MSEEILNERVSNLKELLSIVVSNTKKEVAGGKGQFAAEKIALAKTLRDLIGRKPSKEELALFGV